MTADYIALHAAERPEAVALINGGRAITYAEFDRDLRKFTEAVHVGGIQFARQRRPHLGRSEFPDLQFETTAADHRGVG